MLPQRRRELAAAGNNFTFSNPASKEVSNNGLNHSDEMEYDAWAERIKGQHNYFGKPKDEKFGAWTRRVPRKDNPGEDEFRWLAKTEGDESSTPSPELWKQTGSPVIQSADSSPVRSHGCHNDRDGRFSHINHSARAQTISKYRQEMLDLVRGMPETAYELSLRDIVESPKIATPLQEAVEDKSEEVKDENENENEKTKKKKGKKGESVSRSESMETGGRLLRMLLPKIPSVLGKSTGSSPSAKVSPKPVLGNGEKNGSEKSTDREWWMAEFGQMTSSGGSSRSSNSSGRRSSRKLMGCYPFFQRR